MQASKRRLTCSRASVSSCSNASARLQRRSRTSSAGGDFVAISRKSERLADMSDAKLKVRSGKNGSRLASTNLKSRKKSGKATKFRKPTLESLQNAVVLAPFHTLKRVFQNKLVDLYSHEKLKRINNKMKMAKKQNVSFEYDVVELKPTDNRSRKKERTLKKKKPAQTKSRRKRSKASRSLSYCQCEKNAPKNGSKPLGRNTAQGMKGLKRDIRTRDSVSLDPFCCDRLQFTSTGAYPGQGNKKRKMDNQFLCLKSLKTDFGVKANEGLYEGVGTAVSNHSSQVDSWETYSDSLSLREEHLEGSLAISTTSFDSCMEKHQQPHFSFGDERSKRRKVSKYKSRKQTAVDTIGNDADCRLELSPKSNSVIFGEPVMNLKKKKSDNRITESFDREAEIQGLSDTDESENADTLRRLSKTRGKKQINDTGSSKNYYLRSLKDNALLGEEKESYLNKNINSKVSDGRELEHSTTALGKNNFEIKVRSHNPSEAIEVLEPEDSRRKKFQTTEQDTTESNPEKQTHCLYPTSSPVKILEETSSQTDDISETVTTSKEPKTSDRKKNSLTNVKEARAGSNNATEPHFQSLQKRSSTTLKDDVTVQEKQLPGKLSGEKKSLQDDEEKKIVSSRTNMESALRSEEENCGDLFSEVLPQIENASKCYESAGTTKGANQPEDKEETFIFGSRSPASRFGESCEFSFGLHWALSDDEDNDDINHFF